MSNCAQLPRACVRLSGRGSECQMWPLFIMDEGGEHEGLFFFFVCVCLSFSFVFFFVPAAEFRRPDFYCVAAVQRS